MKKVKALNMRWTVLLVGLGVLSGFTGGYNTNEYKHMTKDVTVTETTNKDGKQVFNVSSKNMDIELVQVADDMEDLLITPKNGFNMTPEFDYFSSDNYRDVYLVGLTKDRAMKVREGQKKLFPSLSLSPFTWDE